MGPPIVPAWSRCGWLIQWANRGRPSFDAQVRERFAPQPAEDARMRQGPRVAVIGLDCATPRLLFRDLAGEVPNIRALMERGMYGDLESITPPITVPAWACAMTGKTPGQLGIYGFRNRKDN